jgi:hypothetical protein
VPLKVVQFLALALTALALVPSGAHLFALPNKINLVAEQYFIAQNIYRGWSLFGIVLFGALIANLALALFLRGRGAPFVLALLAFLCIALRLVVFFIWTYPAKIGLQQLDDDPGQLGAIAQGVGVFARRQCRPHLCGVLRGHPVRADDAGTNAERRGWRY